MHQRHKQLLKAAKICGYKIDYDVSPIGGLAAIYPFWGEGIIKIYVYTHKFIDI